MGEIKSKATSNVPFLGKGLMEHQRVEVLQVFQEFPDVLSKQCGQTLI